MELVQWIAIFVVSLAVLVKAADYFIESAEKIGAALKINPFIIGVTVVALGTSLPELITSLIAVFAGSTEIVIGNVVGSNIANFGLVMGIVAIAVKSVQLKVNVMTIEMPFFVGSGVLVSIMMIDGTFDFWDGIVACLGMIIFLIYTLKDGSDHSTEAPSTEETKLPMAAIVVFILSGVGIYFSAKYNIDAVIKIADILHIGSEVVAQTAVALGTSLPELIVSIAAAKKNNLEIAIGNLIGSNIFNSFAVLGIPALIAPLVVPSGMLTLSIPVMLLVTAIFFIMMVTHKVSRWHGYMLLLCYVFFVMSIIKGVVV